MTAVSALAAACPALAAPQGGVVTSGQANISTQGNTTNINQSTYQAIINWQFFSIAPNEAVNFHQPGPLAVTLNRVVGNEKSVIAGALNANGQVFIVNSAGVVFAKGAEVNVGGLVASTLDISDKNFKAGVYQFSGNSTAAVVNSGHIHASPGGYVALLGSNVSNEGAITAKLGTVALAAGNKVTLNFGGNALLDVTTDEGVLNALVANKGAIKADGGRVILTARAADALLSAQVNNTGVIQAQTLAALRGGETPRTGSIKLLATGGKVNVAGRLDASAPHGGKGGTIETSGSKVAVSDKAVVTTEAASGKSGSWLIDPDGFTIGTGGDITATALSNLLGLNTITILSTAGSGTDGNINVNGAVKWTADTTLTLTATNNININAPITATGASAGLVLNFGGDYVFKDTSSKITLSGTNATLAINGQSYQLIHNLKQLEAISPDGNTNANGFYALAQNIDASGKTFTGPVINDLEGTLAGLNHTISNLTINDPQSRNADGLIGLAGASTGLSAVVRDIGLLNVNVYAGAPGNGGTAGALVNTNYGTISNAYAVGGSVAGDIGVGGLVYLNWGGIENSHANVAVSGTSAVGGLVGWNTFMGVIKNSYADSPVNAAPPPTDTGLVVGDGIGGLVGKNYGSISGSHATGNVTTVDEINVGGLVGLNFGIPAGWAPGSPGAITNSYATGSINYTFQNKTSAYQYFGVGGLVGHNSGGYVSGSQASGTITVNNPNGASYAVAGIGGLVGWNETAVDGSGSGGVISNSTANVNITNNGYIDSVGGLVGYSLGGSITGSSAIGHVPLNPNVGNSGGFVGAGSGVAYSGDSYNASSTGQKNAVGAGDLPPGAPVPGITAIANPSLPSLPVPTQTQLAASRGATVAGTVDVQQSAANPPKPKQIASAGTAKTAALSSPSLGENISLPSTVSEVEGLRRRQAAEAAKRGRSAALGEGRGDNDAGEAAPRRHAAGATTPKVASKPKPKGAGFGATIRNIDVDGKSFELQGKPDAQQPPADNR